MTRCAVIIGVDRVGLLDPLQGAAKGAKDFNAWALSQGINTVLLTDESNKVVKSDEIYDAVKTFNVQNFEQIIIFFSGHGILKSANNEFWLLSNAPEDATAAVNVSSSILAADRCNFSHVVIIADCCRTNPKFEQYSEIQGRAIFPILSKPDLDHQVFVDQFYATKRNDSAYAVQLTSISEHYTGIFTDSVLEGLKGKAKGIEHPYASVMMGYPTLIMAQELKFYLDKHVPKKSVEHKIFKGQAPECQVLSYPPKYVAQIPVGTTGHGKIKVTEILPQDIPKPSLDPPGMTDLAEGGEVYRARITEKLHEVKPFMVMHESARLDQMFQNETREGLVSLLETATQTKDIFQKTIGVFDRLEKISGYHGYDFVIASDSIDQLDVDKGTYRIIKQDGFCFITILGKFRVPSPILLSVGNGIWAPLTLLKGFTGIVQIDNGLMSNINYVPKPENQRFNEYAQRKSEININRAIISTAAQLGYFRLEGNSSEILDAAKSIRYHKAYDPTLGLFASMAYTQLNRLRDVNSVFNYMAKEREPVLFDVHMLNQIYLNKDNKQFSLLYKPNPDFLYPSSISAKPKRVTSFCPLLTQSWSYLELLKGEKIDSLIRLGKYLVPGLWTNFNTKGKEFIDNHKSLFQ